MNRNYFKNYHLKIIQMFHNRERFIDMTNVEIAQRIFFTFWNRKDFRRSCSGANREIDITKQETVREIKNSQWNS